jgi:transmembrane sensor
MSVDIAAQAAEWFARLQEDGASEQDFAEWHRWLSADPAHQRMYRDVEEAWYLIGKAELKDKERVGSQNRLPWALAAALSLCVIAPLASKWFSTSQRYETAIAEQRSLRLPDGSRVTLGALSEIRPSFNGAERRIALERGEAFFEVTRDPARPFIVTAAGSEIRALGTAFNVRARADRVLVSVTEGRVAVRQEASAPQVMLSAGEQGAIARGTKTVQPPVKGINGVSWLQGRFEYRGEELRHVVEDLNRYTDRPIVLVDENLGALRYSGTVFPDHLDEWLRGIGGALPVTVRDAGKHREIVSAR